MSMSKPAKKKLIVISVTAVLVAALITGIYFFVQYQNDQKTVEVLPVSNISTQYWGDDNYSQGIVTNSYVQEIYPDSSKIISEVLVQEGDAVAIGDILIQYDKTKLEIDVESAEISIKETDIKLEDAQKQLKKLQKTKPVATAKPTTKPSTTPRPTNQPTTRPTASPTPVPTPSPIPGADVTLYSRLDLTSVPYLGSGTPDDPYRFLCTDDCVITAEFIQWLFGAGASQPTPEPTLEPTSEPTSEPDEEDPEVPDDGQNPEPTPEPTAEPAPGTQLVSPFVAVFEVRDGNSNYGALISSFTLDGTDSSGSIQISGSMTGNNTVESLAQLFEANSKTTSDNYDDMGYTSAELTKLIADKKQEIKNLQLERKQNKLNLERANLMLKNSTVLSTVDGMVKTLTDLDTATAAGTPFLVVSGDDRTYITGVISENLLGSVNVGDTLSAMSWNTQTSYSAEIVSISDYPLDTSNGYYYSGTGNPNSSYYEFVSVVQEEAANLKNGDYLELTISVTDNSNTDTLYLWKPYMKDDDVGTYVMKAGIDNRLVKQYLELGKSIYGGEYTEVKAGLTMNDYVAFPGTDAKQGVRVVAQGTNEPPGLPDSSSSIIDDGFVSIPETDFGGGEESTIPPEDGESSFSSQEESNLSSAYIPIDDGEGVVILG